jgi:hypothetical protein
MSVEHVDPLHRASITLFSTLRNEDLLPRDIAVELLPWLPTPREGSVPVQEQFAKLRDMTGWQAVRQYFGISLAISQDVTPIGAVESLSQLAPGIRTFLLAGKLNRNISRLMRDYEDSAKHLDSLERAEETRPPGAPRDAAADEELGMLLIRSRDLLRQIADAPKNRVGFLLEVGAAQVLRVPDNRFSQARVVRRGAWLSPIYRFDAKPTDIAGLIRFTGERESSIQMLDVGIRVGAHSGGVYYSFEAVGRRRFVDDPNETLDRNNGRVAGAVIYGFNRSTQVNFTFGKNYDEDFSHGGSMLASFGLTIGLGEIPLGTVSERN